MAKNRKYNSCINEQKKNNIPFQSSTILLSVMREEYAKERERGNIIDNKAELFITAIIAIITIFIPMIPFDRIIDSYENISIMTVIETVILCVFVYALGKLICAFYILFQVINLKDYSRPDLQSLKDQEIQQQKETITANGLLEHFYTIVSTNINVNNGKSEKLKLGFKFCIIGFALLAFSTIGLNIIL